MTVNTVEIRKTYNGNGITDAFATPYFLADADLAVYVDGILQTITTDYTVAGAGIPAGGTVTFVTPPPTGTANVIIIRDPALTQLTDWVENDANGAEVKETAFDKLTMIAQRQQDKFERCLRLQDSDLDVDMELPLKSTRVNKFLAFDSNGEPVASAFGSMADGQVFSNKAAAVAYIDVNGITNGQAYFITSDDGGTFTGVTGASAATYADDGGTYCGTQFIPTGGDGSSGIVRKYDGALYPHWYGAVDDDTTDALAAFDNMVASLAAAGGGKISVPDNGGSAYYLSAAVELSSNIIVDIDPTVKFRTDTSVGWSPGTFPDPQFKNACFIFNGSLNQAVSTTFSVSAAIDDTSATVASVTGFAVGDDVWIADDTLVDASFHYAKEWNRIIDITGSVVTFEMPLNFAYALTDTTMYKITPCENSHITGGIFDQAADTTNETHGIGGQFAKGCSVRASKGQNLRGKLIAVWSSYDFNTYKPEVIDAQVTTAGLGYGVQYLLCRHSNIFGGMYSNLRHATDFSGGSDLLVTGAHAVWEGQSAGTAAYSMGHGLRTRRQKVVNSFAANWSLGAIVGNATFDGDYDSDVTGNTFINCGISAYYNNNSSGGKVTGNTLINSGTIAVGISVSSGIDVYDNRMLGTSASTTTGVVNIQTGTDINVYKNVISDGTKYGIYSNSGTNISIEDNEISNCTDKDIFVNLTNAGKLAINRNEIECAAGAFESIYVLGQTAGGQIARLEAKGNSIIGAASRTVGIRAAYVAQAVIENNTIEDVAEGVRCDFGDSPTIIGNRIDNVTNGIRLTDDATDVMTTYYSASNVVTNFTANLLNSAGAALGTFV